MSQSRVGWAGIFLVLSTFASLLSSAVHGRQPQERDVIADEREAAKGKERREPTPQEDQKLRSIANTLRPGVVLFAIVTEADGGPFYLPRGSGFVVSKQHRLVATAAHVADDFSLGEQVFAFIEGSTQSYRVKRAYYHPGLERELDVGLYARSDNPRDGKIDFGRTPDVAVLQLSELGSELPFELELGNDDDFKNIEGQPVGLLGFSYHNDWSMAHSRSSPQSKSLELYARKSNRRSARCKEKWGRRTARITLVPR